MDTENMTLHELIEDIAQYELMNFVQNNIVDNFPEEEFDEQTNKYLECDDYLIHLDYLIENWKTLIDEKFNDDFKFDYNLRGTFKNLCQYTRNINMPSFNDKWLHDIFDEHIILLTNVYLK